MATMTSGVIGSGLSTRVVSFFGLLVHKAREFDRIAMWARAAVDGAECYGTFPDELKLDTLR